MLRAKNIWLRNREIPRTLLARALASNISLDSRPLARLSLALCRSPSSRRTSLVNARVSGLLRPGALCCFACSLETPTTSCMFKPGAPSSCSFRSVRCEFARTSADPGPQSPHAHPPNLEPVRKQPSCTPCAKAIALFGIQPRATPNESPRRSHRAQHIRARNTVGVYCNRSYSLRGAPQATATRSSLVPVRRLVDDASLCPTARGPIAWGSGLTGPRRSNAAGTLGAPICVSTDGCLTSVSGQGNI